MRKIVIILFLCTLFSGAVYGGVDTAAPHINKGKSLYDMKMWSAARKEFEKARKHTGSITDPMTMRCDYMIAICAAEADDADAQIMLEAYLAKYSNTIYHNDVLFAVSNQQYLRGMWDEAMAGYLSVDPFSLAPIRQNEYFFKLGHCYFNKDDIGNASDNLMRVDRKSDYGTAALYYISYIRYTEGDYAPAKEGFQTLLSDPAYGAIAPFYILQIEFLQKNYNYVTQNGDALIKTATRERAAETARIMAESWYHLGGHAKTLDYIDLFRSLGGQAGRNESYIEGYCLYMTGDYAKATVALAEACGPEDALSQNAAYHLADCYLKMGDKRSAMQSFSIAASGNFDKNIREDALFNYGKLQYDLGGGVFNEAINVLNRYIKEYPTSSRVNQAREYLLAAYYNSRNYEAAYEAIKLIPNPDNNVKSALQKITYFRAMEHFSAGNLDEAQRLLEISSRNRYNAKYTALSSYWRGEIAYHRGNFAAAIPLYKEYINVSPKTEPEHAVANYAVGYSYFNLKQWEEARSWFDRYLALKPTEKDYMADTYNRLGDIKYTEHSFWQAIEEYDKAIRLQTSERYYSEWRRAVLLGMVDRMPRKEESLQAIISAGKGNYVDDALYELGRTYMGMDRFSDAAATLSKYVDSYPDGASRVDALSDLGLVYQNMGQSDKALDYYKKIVTTAPNSPQAKDALLGIRSVYMERNDVDGYFSYASGTGMEADLTAVKRDSLSFASAQRQYLVAADPKSGVTALKSYITNYPKGVYRAQALYNLAEASLRTGDRKQSLDAYAELSTMHFNEYTVRSLEHLARMQEENKSYAEAAVNYRKLSQTAFEAAVINRALEGYLRTSLQVPTADLIAVTGEILASPHAGQNVIRSSSFVKAKTLWVAGKNAEAMPVFEKLSTESQSAEGAESAYIVIESLAAAGKNAEAKKRIFALSEQNSPHTYWVGKAFLALGQIYVKEGDTFQARATYQSIVDGYSVANDGITDQAREAIKNLK